MFFVYFRTGECPVPGFWKTNQDQRIAGSGFFFSKTSKGLMGFHERTGKRIGDFVSSYVTISKKKNHSRAVLRIQVQSSTPKAWPSPHAGSCFKNNTECFNSEVWILFQEQKEKDLLYVWQLLPVAPASETYAWMISLMRRFQYFAGSFPLSLASNSELMLY
jgi:hypothetical protein